MLIGKWIARNVSAEGVEEMDLTEEMKVGIEQLRKAFIGSRYTLHSDGKFNLQFGDRTPEFVTNKP